MTRTWLIGVALTGLVGSGLLVAQGAKSAEVQLKAAQHKEEVEGDLKGAIEQYRKVVADTRDRALAARALVHMAECYQKLGDGAGAKDLRTHRARIRGSKSLGGSGPSASGRSGGGRKPQE